MKPYRAFEASLSEEQAEKLRKDGKDFVRWLKLLGVVTIIALALGQYARWFDQPHQVQVKSYTSDKVCVVHLGWTRLHTGGSNITQCAYPELKGLATVQPGEVVQLGKSGRFHEGRAIFELSPAS